MRLLEFFESSQYQGDTISKSLENIDSQLTTPPPKRRRGRPPKCLDANSNLSQAATLSAAVVKQGTPKASSPLMRISPVRHRKGSLSSPAAQQDSTVTPSPKGGFLMRLDGSSGAKKGRPKRAKQAQLLPNSSTKRQNVAPSVSFYDMLPASTISLKTQENIQALTSSNVKTDDIGEKSSVNPSLLLSSPIPNVNRAFSNRKDALNYDDQQYHQHITSIDVTNKTNSQVQINITSSSPMTPNSLASSCFSSIMQSSPLYHGYYANQSSPNTSKLSSSPMKFQLKPIDLPESKKKENKVSLPKINELPKNPFNSPNLKPTDPSVLLGSDDKASDYKLTLSIDEMGQAKIVKEKSSKSSGNSLKPAFSSQQAKKRLVNPITQTPIASKGSQATRAISIGTPVERKTLTQTPIFSPHSLSIPSTQLNDMEMFIEPSRMTTDSLFNDLTESIGFEGLSNSQTKLDIPIQNASSSSPETHILEDESMNFDARKALIKMIRRSV